MRGKSARPSIPVRAQRWPVEQVDLMRATAIAAKAASVGLAVSIAYSWAGDVLALTWVALLGIRRV